MPEKTLIDASSQNFDLYFANEIGKITPENKESLPRDIAFKLFRKGGEFNSKSTSKLSFLLKLFILVRSLKKRWFLIIEDNETGVDINQFIESRKEIERDFTLESAEELKESGAFILGTKELLNTFSYLNRLSSSSAYNYLVKSKNIPINKVDKFDKGLSYVSKFLCNYESQKKNIISNFGISMPEFYVLLALYHGDEVPSSTIYKQTFKRAYQSSPTKIKTAFSSLQQRNFIVKYGGMKFAKLQITPLGKDLLGQIFNKYVVNC